MNEQKEINNCLEYALNYLGKGLSVIPVGKDKVPLIPWKKYQEQCPSEEEVKEWWKLYPDANVGVITGKISNLLVVDVEKGGDISKLPKTAVIKTGGGGWHFYYKYQAGYENKARILPLTDIRGEGGYIVAPPSVHASGNRYEVLENVPLAEFPVELFGVKKQVSDWPELVEGVPQGVRNETAAKVAGKLLRTFQPGEWGTTAWPMFKKWNDANKPPLAEYELRNIYKSISGRAINDTRPEENPFENEFIQLGSFEPISLSQLMIKKFEEAIWVVDRLIPFGITAISGNPSAYKTWFVLSTALNVASGDILFDEFPTKQMGILIIDEENGERLLQKRLKKLCQKFELPIYFHSLRGFHLKKEAVEQIIEIVQKINVGLIIFDSLIRIHGADENDASKMAGVFRYLKEFNKNNISVVFTHHNRKQGFFKGDLSQSMRGSSDILASVDCHLALEKKNKEDLIIVTQTKNRLEKEIKPFKLGIMNDEENFSFDYLGEVDEAQTKKGDCKEAIKEILEREDKPMYKKELFESLRQGGLELGYSTFKTATGEMVEAGELFERRGERNKVYCFSKPFEEVGAGQNSSSIKGEEF